MIHEVSLVLGVHGQRKTAKYVFNRTYCDEHIDMACRTEFNSRYPIYISVRTSNRFR